MARTCLDERMEEQSIGDAREHPGQAPQPLSGRARQTGTMPWLVSGDRVLASLEVAGSARARARGLLGRDALEGALWLPRTRSVHTLGMRFAIDVAYCDAEGQVLAIVTMRPWRLGRPRLRARSVVEAQAGNLQRWGITAGSTLEVQE